MKQRFSPKLKSLALVAAVAAVSVVTLFAASTPFVGFKSDGYYIGFRTADKVAFYGTHPISQQAVTVPTRTAFQALGLQAADGTLTATATSGAATLNTTVGTVTSEALTTAAGAAYTLTLTDSAITANSVVLPSVDTGTNTTAGLEVGKVHPASGSATILVWNRHASSPLNGTIKVSFLVAK